jgi:glycine/D-amino acid oxidase-like deaminating enzyme
MPNFTRRDILTAFLGMPVALAACRSRPATLPPHGHLVGPSDSIGHRVRDGLNITVPAGQWQNVGVVIIGGGIAGLSAAWRLQQAGMTDFVVLELEDQPGGTSRSDASPLVPYPWGAHYLPVPLKENTQLVSLLDEMGFLEGRTQDGEPIVAEQYLCRDPQERLFYRGRWYEGLYLHAGASAEDNAQFAAFIAEINRWVAWRDAHGRRAFAIPVAASSDDAEVTALDTITMSEWITQHGWTSPRLRWLVDYGCRDDFGLTIEQTSAWAGIFYFAARIRNPGDDAQPLMTWPDGNGRLVTYLYNTVRANVRLSFAATDVLPVSINENDHVEILAFDRNTLAPVGFRANRVIVATPQFLSRYLIRPYRESPPTHLQEFTYGSWMVTNLSLTQRPEGRGFPLAWDNVLYDSPSLGYVVATHQRGLDHGPTMLTYYYPFCDTDPQTVRAKLLAMDWQTCADIVLTDLRRPHPHLHHLVERLDVMRWGHAMIRPQPGFVWSEARRKAALPFRGIHFANTDLSGVALFEEAFYHGVRAAEEVLGVQSPESRVQSLR